MEPSLTQLTPRMFPGVPINLFSCTPGANRLTPDLRSLDRDDLSEVSQRFAPRVVQKLILLVIS